MSGTNIIQLWTDREGKQRISLEVHATEMQFIDRGRSDEIAVSRFGGAGGEGQRSAEVQARAVGRKPGRSPHRRSAVGAARVVGAVGVFGRGDRPLRRADPAAVSDRLEVGD